MRWSRARHAAFAAAAVACIASPASAQPEAMSCEDAFTAAPKLVKAGQLLRGRESLVRCSSESCPTAMRSLCAEDLRQVETRVPTIVFVARGSDGSDLRDVRVTEGGQILEEHLDGRSVDVDPGDHVFRLERGEGGAVTVSVLAHEGEKSRQVVATFPASASATGGTVPPVPPESTPSGARPIPWTVYVTGAVAVVAAGSYAYFGIHGLSQRSALADCKGGCDHDSVQSVRTNLAVADGSWIVALVAAAATVGLYLLR